MKHYQVGDSVFAKANGFQPFPAVIENVLLKESDSSVFYYVRFLGASEVVPLGAENLLPIKENRQKFKLTYSEKEMREEAKLRVNALLGADDEIPEVLMNFVTVDSDFEEVSEETVKRLGLHSIMITPSTIHELDKVISSRSGKSDDVSDMDDDFVDVEEVPSESESLQQKLKSKSSYPCATCSKTYKTRRALGVHKQRSLLCSNKALGQAVRTERLKTHQKKLNSGGTTQNLPTKAPDHDLNKKVEELIAMDKSKWGNRSASGYYPCKLCFRKFRSKGEVQSHMATHLSHMGLKRNVVQSSQSKEESVWDSSEDEDSISVGDDTEFKNTKHCSMERERRAELAVKFAELAKAQDLPVGTSKARTLENARVMIAELEKDLKDQMRQIAQLKDTNLRLNARYLGLNPGKSAKIYKSL